MTYKPQLDSERAHVQHRILELGESAARSSEAVDQTFNIQNQEIHAIVAEIHAVEASRIIRAIIHQKSLEWTTKRQIATLQHEQT